jgi:hypothetical protein
LRGPDELKYQGASIVVFLVAHPAHTAKR